MTHRVHAWYLQSTAAQGRREVIQNGQFFHPCLSFLHSNQKFRPKVNLKTLYLCWMHNSLSEQTTV